MWRRPRMCRPSTRRRGFTRACTSAVTASRTCSRDSWMAMTRANTIASLHGDITMPRRGDACRALRGSVLRSEVYGQDGSLRHEHPYTVTEQNFTVSLVQPRGDNRHAVFFTHAREALAYHYERNPTDPRVAHTLTLDVDEYGGVRRAASVVY